MLRTLACHQYGARSIPALCHVWVEFVVGSRLAPKVCLRVLRFSSLHKNQTKRKVLYQNALEYNVYHRCLFYILNQATLP